MQSGRRQFLGAVAAACTLTGVAAVPGLRAAGAPPRLAVLDYGLVQTLLALGVPPVAMAAPHQWPTWVGAPALPPGIANLGLSREVNLELLQALAPDLILSTPFLERLHPRLSRIAPVRSFAIHATGGPALPSILEATGKLARLTRRPQAGSALIAAAEGQLAATRRRLAPHRALPLLLASFLDARHLRIYGAGCLLQDTLDRLALRNAWTGPVGAWGFATQGIEALARLPPCRLVLFDPLPADAAQMMAQSPLWQATGMGQPLRLPAVLPFGMLPSVTRFATLLEAGLRNA